MEPHEIATDVIGTAFEIGMSYFDVAPYYGFGLAERRLGDALRDVTDEFIVSTKVGRLLLPDEKIDTSKARSGFLSPLKFSPLFDYTYDGIMRSHESSLSRLGLPKVDLLLVHDIGTFSHGENNERFLKDLRDSGSRALEQLRSSGAVSAIGLGVNEIEICETLISDNVFDCFMLAGCYTLLNHKGCRSLAEKSAKAGVGIIAAAPYNGGLLAPGAGSSSNAQFNFQPAEPEILGRLRTIERICNDFGVPLSAAALQLPLRNSSVSSVVVGMSTRARALETRSLLDWPIPGEFWSALYLERLLEV